MNSFPEKGQDEQNGGQQGVPTKQIDFVEALLVVLRVIVIIMVIWTMRNIAQAWEAHMIKEAFLHSQAFSSYSTSTAHEPSMAD